jgi:hypothetical protein
LILFGISGTKNIIKTLMIATLGITGAVLMTGAEWQRDWGMGIIAFTLFWAWSWSHKVEQKAKTEAAALSDDEIDERTTLLFIMKYDRRPENEKDWENYRAMRKEYYYRWSIYNWRIYHAELERDL